ALEMAAEEVAVLPALDDVLFVARQEPMHRLALAVLVDEGRNFLVLRIEVEIVISGDGMGIALGRRVSRDVLDQFASDIDFPAVAERLQVFLPTSHFYS